ncbi:nose resistant to fluoxetine protein 6 [Diachasma alloeum]|uniref:nose resistant to fluoxetine protein 6 n=1 Tax=Diachasma alloeum TaxID=454923 RepID=UPI0007382C3C|nr:nose resistant to fluoxetine protein 6 [Diachasma alloeum]
MKMILGSIGMGREIISGIASAVFVIVSVAGAAGAPDNLTDMMGHVLPAYAIAGKSHLLAESSKCREELEVFREGVDARKLWSLRMLDSSGVPRSGFIYGNNYWMGSKSQCYDILNPEPLALHPKWLENNTLYRNPKEELAPYQLNYFAAQFVHNSTLQYHHRIGNEHMMVLGLCLPSTCEAAELGLILQKIFDERTLSLGEVYGMDFKLLRVKDLKNDPQYLINWRMLTVISVIIATLTMMIIGTCYDVRVHQERLKVDKSSGTSSILSGQDIIGEKLTAENGDSPSLASPSSSSPLKTGGKILMCFSVYTNSKDLFRTSLSRGSVASLHGLRFLGMVWIIVLHTPIYVQESTDNKIWSMRLGMGFASQILSNGSLSVDTYFFLSGFLLSHIFFKNRKRSGDAAKPEGNPREGFGLGTFTQSVVARVIRLTPAYMMVVGIAEMNAQFYSRTSPFYMIERPQDTCPKYWWRNLLYINNFFSREEMCLSWSWYLSNDTQFFIFGTALLLISARYFYTAAGIFVATLFTSSLISGYVAYIYDYVPTLDEQWNTFEIFYDPPWMRIGPYLVGIATAYLLSRMENKLNVGRKTLWLLWICGSSCSLLVLFGLYDRTVSVVPVSVYIALGRTAWGVGIAWVVIACCTNHGGIVNTILTFKGWIPLSKLTYCAYLLNPFLVGSVSLSSEATIHIDLLLNGTTSFGFLVITYFSAYVTYLMFEAPYILLLKLFYTTKKSRR